MLEMAGRYRVPRTRNGSCHYTCYCPCSTLVHFCGLTGRSASERIKLDRGCFCSRRSPAHCTAGWPRLRCLYQPRVARRIDRRGVAVDPHDLWPAAGCPWCADHHNNHRLPGVELLGRADAGTRRGWLAAGPELSGNGGQLAWLQHCPALGRHGRPGAAGWSGRRRDRHRAEHLCRRKLQPAHGELAARIVWPGRSDRPAGDE